MFINAYLNTYKIMSAVRNKTPPSCPGGSRGWLNIWSCYCHSSWPGILTWALGCCRGSGCSELPWHSRAAPVPGLQRGSGAPTAAAQASCPWLTQEPLAVFKIKNWIKAVACMRWVSAALFNQTDFCFCTFCVRGRCGRKDSFLRPQCFWLLDFN